MSKCFYRLFLCVLPFLLTISCTNNHDAATDPKCGNGIVETGEKCDGDEEVDCSDVHGMYIGGMATCSPDCSGYDTSDCEEWHPQCGNGIVEAWEECDSDEEVFCADIHGMYIGGMATCLPDCSGYDTGDCKEYHPECKLSDDFFDAMPNEWTSFFTMMMAGLINDPENYEPDFAYTATNGATLKGVPYDLDSSYGMYQLDSVQTSDGATVPAVMAVGVGTLTWPVTNKLAVLWASQTFVEVDDLLNWKDQAKLEGRTDATIDSTTLVVVFEVWIEISGSNQYTRMECIRGLSKAIDANPGYEGAMFVCTNTNTDWAIGEGMKMMQYSHMVDDETELLAIINQGIETSDPYYRTDVCQCWQQDGMTIMDCEDMKDEFGVGELPDEEADADILQSDALLPDE